MFTTDSATSKYWATSCVVAWTPSADSANAFTLSRTSTRWLMPERMLRDSSSTDSVYTKKPLLGLVRT